MQASPDADHSNSSDITSSGDLGRIGDEDIQVSHQDSDEISATKIAAPTTLSDVAAPDAATEVVKSPTVTLEECIDDTGSMTGEEGSQSEELGANLGAECSEEDSDEVPPEALSSQADEGTAPSKPSLQRSYSRMSSRHRASIMPMEAPVMEAVAEAATVVDDTQDAKKLDTARSASASRSLRELRKQAEHQSTRSQSTLLAEKENGATSIRFAVDDERSLVATGRQNSTMPTRPTLASSRSRREMRKSQQGSASSSLHLKVDEEESSDPQAASLGSRATRPTLASSRSRREMRKAQENSTSSSLRLEAGEEEYSDTQAASRPRLALGRARSRREMRKTSADDSQNDSSSDSMQSPASLKKPPPSSLPDGDSSQDENYHSEDESCAATVPGAFRAQNGYLVSPDDDEHFEEESGPFVMHEKTAIKKQISNKESFDKEAKFSQDTTCEVLLEATLVTEMPPSPPDGDDRKPAAVEDLEANDNKILISNAVAVDPKKNKRRLIIFASAIMIVVIVVIVLGVTGVFGGSGNSDSVASSDQFSFKDPGARARILAAVPEPICVERVPGEGRSVYCSRNETLPQGGAAANLVAKAMLMQIPDGEIALQNAGAVRVDIDPGNFTGEDALTLLPFQSSMLTVRLAGRQIKLVLEQALAKVAALRPSDGTYVYLTGAFPYTAALRFDVNMLGEPGELVSDIEVNPRLAGEWAPLKLERVYTVIVNDYIGGGGDGYTELVLAEKTEIGVTSTEAFAKYALDVGILKSPPLSEFALKSYIPAPHLLNMIIPS